MNASQSFSAPNAASFNKVLQAGNRFVFSQDHITYKARFLFVRLSECDLASLAAKSLMAVSILAEFLRWPLAFLTIHHVPVTTQRLA